MHDLDRIQLEFEQDDDEFEVDDFDEFESDFDDDEFEWDNEGPLDDDEETELAMELLSITDDEELEQFLGKIFKKVARVARRAVRSPIFKKIVSYAKPIAKKLLPVAGKAIGSYFGGPAGGMAGGALASKISSLFEIDVTGLSGDEMELEVSKRIVRLVGTAAKKALSAPSGSSPSKVAKSAIKSAIKKHAPGLLRSGLHKLSPKPSKLMGQSRSGRWIRRGNKIVIMGA